jgi:hypothetical protein
MCGIRKINRKGVGRNVQLHVLNTTSPLEIIQKYSYGAQLSAAIQKAECFEGNNKYRQLSDGS